MLSLLFLTQGMMGAYGPPFMPMQGPPPEGMMGMGGVPPHPMGVPMPLSHQHQLPAGMPGYPGMPHPGKEQKLPARFSPVSPSSLMACAHPGRVVTKTKRLALNSGRLLLGELLGGLMTWYGGVYLPKTDDLCKKRHILKDQEKYTA